MFVNHKKRRRPVSYGTFAGSRQAEQLRLRDFDRESGLVYDEVELRGPDGYDMSWISNYKTPDVAKTRSLPNEGKGARSLHEMALNKTSRVSWNLTVDALKGLPSSIGQVVWDEIVEDHAETYHIWRVFATSFGPDFAGVANRYMLDIKAPTLDHDDYYRGLDSTSPFWLTCLRISPKQTRVSDLVAVSKITNLAVLDLSDGQLYMETRQSTFDHRVLRSWSELARTGSAFKHLRVLMLGWQEKVGGWMFNLLDDFPQLNLLITTDCHLIDHKNHRHWEQEARDHGWDFMPSKRGVKHLRTLLADPKFYSANVSNLYYESIRTSKEAGKDPRPGSERPLLECWLGAPRAWTHIIDDFPGTKTVIFHREKDAMKPVQSNATTNSSNDMGQFLKGARSKPAMKSHGQPGDPRRRLPKQSAASLLAEMS